MRHIWASMKDNFWVAMVLIFIGFGFGYMYAWNSILLDCKVLGMTRYGNLPIGCRIDGGYK